MIDFMIMEAVYLKVLDEDRQAEKDRKLAEWRSTKNEGNFENLSQFR